MSEIETTSSKIVYENRWMRVREDEILRGNGKPGLYGVIEKTDFVLVIPRFENGDFQLVEQYRYPAEARFWEFPQGSWETRPDVDPLEVAKGELQEETGLIAGSMTVVGQLFLAYGMCNQRYHILLAEQLSQGSVSLEEEEHGLITSRMTDAQVRELICNGTIMDASTVAALALLDLKKL